MASVITTVGANSIGGGGSSGAASQLDANGTTLDVNVINDGEYLVRSGSTIVGSAGSSAPASQLDANGTTLDVNVITDGQALIRTGTTVVSAAFTTIVSATNVLAALAAAAASVAINSQAIIGALSVATGLGSAATPSYTFTGDLNTGLFSPGADRAALATGGTQRFEVSTTAVISTLPISNAVGSGAAPAYAFTARLDDGLFSAGAGRVALATSGTQRFEVSTTAVISTLPISNAVGSAAAPAYSFTARLTDGLYSAGANQVGIATNGAARVVYGDVTSAWTPAAATSGSATHWTFTAAAHTGQTTLTEVNDFHINLLRTVTWATGDIPLQRAVRISQPTYAFAGASIIAVAATVSIGGPPLAGANATITESYALRIATGQTGVPTGTAAAPSIVMLGDPDTGIYSVGANDFGISTGGTLRLDVSTTMVTSTLPFAGPAGTAAAPAHTYSGDPNTGSYSVGADDWGVATNGVLRFDISTAAITSTLPFLGAAGSASAPNWSYSGDPNTGSYSVGADDWGVATNGVLRFDVSTTAVTSTLPYVAPAGAAGTPAYTTVGDLDTGIFFSAANTVNISAGGTSHFQVTASAYLFNPSAASSGSTTGLAYTAAAHTGQQAGTEVISFRANMSAILQHASNTAVTTQRAAVFDAPTYSFASATGTITTAATLAITGAPAAGTNAVITTSLAFWVQGGASRFDGNIGFFSTAPVAQQTVGALTNNVTSGGSSDTIANFTDLTIYANDSAAIRNDIYQLARSVQQHATALRNLGLGV